MNIKINGDILTKEQEDEFYRTFGNITDGISVERTIEYWPKFGQMQVDFDENVSLLGGIMSLAFKKNLPEGKKAKFIVPTGDHDFDLTGVVPKMPDVLFESNTVLDLDGTEVHLIHLGAIRSSSDTIVWIPSEKVVFAGDIFADCSMPMSMDGGKKWIEVMDYILDDLQPEVIVPGHGEVYDRARAENQREYFKSLIEQVERNFTPTIKNDELIAKIDVSKYIDHRSRLGWVMVVNGMACHLRKRNS